MPPLHYYALPFKPLTDGAAKVLPELVFATLIGAVAGALASALIVAVQRARGVEHQWRLWPVAFCAIAPGVLASYRALGWYDRSLVAPMVVLLALVPILTSLSRRAQTLTLSGWLIPFCAGWTILMLVPRGYTTRLTELKWTATPLEWKAEASYSWPTIAMADLTDQSLHVGIVGLMLGALSVWLGGRDPARSATLATFGAISICVAGILETKRAMVMAWGLLDFELALRIHEAQSSLLLGIIAISILSLIRRSLRRDRVKNTEAGLGWVLFGGLLLLATLLSTQVAAGFLTPDHPSRMALLQEPICPTTTCRLDSDVSVFVGQPRDYPSFPPGTAVIDVSFQGGAP